MKEHQAKKLKFTLIMIQQLDKLRHYDRRNQFIYEAISDAMACGLSAGFRIDQQEPEWPVAFIELPGAQGKCRGTFRST